MEIDSGNIHEAMRYVISELVKGEKSHKDILYEWDQRRKGDDFSNYIRKTDIVKFMGITYEDL